VLISHNKCAHMVNLDSILTWKKTSHYPKNSVTGEIIVNRLAWTQHWIIYVTRKNKQAKWFNEEMIPHKTCYWNKTGSATYLTPKYIEIHSLGFRSRIRKWTCSSYRYLGRGCDDSVTAVVSFRDTCLCLSDGHILCFWLLIPVH
jgi:hypothetical protein